jgi:hypothetical protein
MVKPCKLCILQFFDMANILAVSKSKRTPVRLRHKIEKASAAKQRKLRKEAKKVCQPFSFVDSIPDISLGRIRNGSPD